MLPGVFLVLPPATNIVDDETTVRLNYVVVADDDGRGSVSRLELPNSLGLRTSLLER